MIGPVLRGGRAPAVPAAVCLVAGILAGAWSGFGSSAALALLAVAAGALLLSVATGGSAVGRQAGFLGLWLAAGFLCGAVRIAAPAREAESTWRALPDDPQRAYHVEGVLEDFWSGEPPRARNRLRIERILADGTWRPFPADAFLFVSGKSDPRLEADRGDRVRTSGRLRPEDLPASDREVPLPWDRYRLSAKSSLQIERRSRTFLSILAAPNRWIAGRLPAPGERGDSFERNVRGPLTALVLGRTAELDRGMVATYRRGGLYHLLVVSGLHVVMAGGLVLWLLSLAGISGKRRDLILLATIALFVLVAGANPPAVRAGLVFAVFVAARLLERPIGAGQAIGLSAILLFVASPAQAFSIGTILTFAAVGGIALFTERIRARLPAGPEWLFGALAAALAAEVVTAPILFWRFNLVAAGAWLTAPLAVPLSGILIGLGAAILLCFTLGVFPGPLCDLFAVGSVALESLAERAAGIAYLRPTPPLGTILAVSALTVGAACLARGWRAGSALAAASLYGFLVFRPAPPGPARGFSLEALDVGQGDALLLRWDRHAVLVDGGGPFDLEAREFGRTRLIPKLLDRGVTRLDGVALTHPHPDHALGLFSVLEEMPVGRFWRSTGNDEGELLADLEAIARDRGTAVVTLAEGEAVSWRDARLTALHSGGRLRKKDGINNQSLVLLFERHGRRSLLTGDIGDPAEKDLLARSFPPATLLKVAHHGSRTSTIPEFVSAVCPRAAVISCGRENRFGHPHADTLQTLASYGVRTFRTDLFSDVRVELRPESTRLALRGLR
ncbi:MAG: DNA internalization-related competence protein ComEC/Rec2 [Thermoanaerobaculia bacterium]